MVLLLAAIRGWEIFVRGWERFARGWEIFARGWERFVRGRERNTSGFFNFEYNFVEFLAVRRTPDFLASRYFILYTLYFRHTVPPQVLVTGRDSLYI